MAADGRDGVNASVHAATWGDDEPTPEVSTEAMRRIVVERSALILDTRRLAQFEAGHIAGAVNVEGPPESQVEIVRGLVAGDRARALVLYCNGPYCRRTRELSRELTAAGFTGVSRYQLGIPVWRALGGPTVIEAGAIRRIHGIDRTAVFLDARAASDYAVRHLPGAQSVPVDEVAAGTKAVPLPEDDFNTRIVVYGRDGAQALRLAEVLAEKPCHNVTYFPGTFEALLAAIA